MQAKAFEVKLEKDIEYGTGRVRVGTTPRDRALRLDVYAPDTGPTAAGRPALILAFGGAFHRGTKETDETDGEGPRNTPISAYCREFARRGYVACSIDYRLVQEDPDPGNTPVIQNKDGIPRSRVDVVRKILGLPPATIEMLWAGIEAACDDMVKAFRFLQAHAAKYGVDPARVAVGGFSAGARTALNAAYGEHLPAAAVVSISGFMADDDLGKHVTGAAGQPPLFFVTGENDLGYVAGQAGPMDRHFSKVGLRHEAWQVPGGTHFYPCTSPIVGEGGRRSTLEEAMAEFLGEALGHPSGPA